MDLFVADLNKPGPLKQLTDTPGYDAECSFSPDGTQLLFVSDRDGDPDIYVAHADGSHVTQLTNHPGYDGGPFSLLMANGLPTEQTAKRKTFYKFTS